MAVSVAVPDLGEDMAGGLVAEWYRADGAAVQPGDPVCRIECSFVAFEVEAERAGLLRHRRPAGSIERPGVVLGHILGPGESIPAEEHPPRASAPPAPVVTATTPVVESVSLPQSEPEFVFDFKFEPEPEPELVAPQLVVVESAVFEPEDEPREEAEPLQEFEEALTEAVVVPFPRRFAMQPGIPLDEEVPGDLVAFDTSLFDPPGGEVAQSLPEPGGTIPGLALWDAEEQQAAATAISAPAAARFTRIVSEAVAAAQVLSMSVVLDSTEAERMRTVLTREWRHAGITPLFEDIVFRAIALALREHSGVESAGALLIAEAASDVSSALARPATNTLREAVQLRERGGDAEFESAGWLLVSLAAQGIATATPRLDTGRDIAFAIGVADSAGRATLTAAYDSSQWSEGSTARLLARAREIFEAPYAMLV